LVFNFVILASELGIFLTGAATHCVDKEIGWMDEAVDAVGMARLIGKVD
jgi:hypothetical protein